MPAGSSRLCTICASILATVLSGALTLAQAQVSVTLTSPTAPVTVREGRDYFTEKQAPNRGNVLWRVGWYENYKGESVRVEDGKWIATALANDPYFFVPHGGISENLYSAESLPGDRAIPLNGLNHKIDASVFTMLSWTIDQENNRPSLYLPLTALYWAKGLNAAGTYWPDATNGVYGFLGEDGVTYRLTHSGEHTYFVDLAAPSPSTSSFQMLTGATGSFTNDVTAIRISPSTSAGVNANTRLGAVRLVDPNSTDKLTVRWNPGGNIQLNQASTQYLTVLYTTNPQQAGIPLKTFTTAPAGNQFVVPLAIFPPGTYYFYVEVKSAVSGHSVLARSALSSAVTVTAKPIITVMNPAPNSGKEYFDENGLTFSSINDVANMSPDWTDSFRDFYNATFNSDTSVFQAIAKKPVAPRTENDSRVARLISSTATPIDTGEYCYAVPRFWLDRQDLSSRNGRSPSQQSISDLVRDGNVGRIIAWPERKFTTEHYRSDDWIVYPKDDGSLQTYVINLCDPKTQDFGSVLWNGSQPLRGFGLDPAEYTTADTAFKAGATKLYARPRPVNGFYTINWNVSDTDSTSFTTRLFAGTAADGSNRVQIGLVESGSGDQSFIWDTASLPDNQDYWVFVDVSDAFGNLNMARSYVPMRSGVYTAPRSDSVRELRGFAQSVSNPKRTVKKGRTATTTIETVLNVTTGRAFVNSFEVGITAATAQLSNCGSGNFRMRTARDGSWFTGANIRPLYKNLRKTTVVGPCVIDVNVTLADGGTISKQYSFSKVRVHTVTKKTARSARRR